MSIDEDQVWAGVAGVAALAAAAASKPLVEKVWTRAVGHAPPEDPAHLDVTWREALLWAVISGAVVGVVRLLAQRGAASAWARTRGDYPVALRSTRS